MSFERFLNAVYSGNERGNVVYVDHFKFETGAKHCGKQGVTIIRRSSRT